MKTLLTLILWCMLFVMCWPLAIALILLFPLIWLVLLPFRVIGFTIETVFKLVGALFMLPFRILGVK